MWSGFPLQEHWVSRLQVTSAKACPPGGHEEGAGQAVLACWIPWLQNFTQCPVSLLLQVPDVGGGMEAWHICSREGKAIDEHPLPATKG
jgi:hypothetical protein